MSMKLTSSFTFRIISAMLLIAVVPASISLFIFERIDSFNQSLQKEAADSIDSVSDVYKSWVYAESERIRLIDNKVAFSIEEIVRKQQFLKLPDIRTSRLLQDEIYELFRKTTDTEDIVFEIVLLDDMKPIVKYGTKPDNPDNYRYQADSVDIAVIGMQTGTEHEEPAEEDGIPMLVAQPVDEDGAEKPHTEFSLPGDIQKLRGNDAVMSKRGLQVVLKYGLPKAQIESYERLGERRYLHGAITAAESDGGFSVTQIYQIIFVTVAGIVIILAVIFACWLAIPLSRRLTSLTNSVRRVAEGDLQAKVDVTGNDQITYLMTQFNSMLDDVKSAQESKAYIERVQAWREVARRLAHEIKNPLTPIVLAIQQLDKKFDDYIDRPQKYRKLMTDVVEIVNEETDTLRKLVKNFTEFARMPIPEMKEACFYDFTVQTVQQNPQFAEESKRVEVHPADSETAGRVLSFDPELMRRVIVNIVRNGIEAARNAHIEPEIDIYVLAADDAKTGPRSRTCLRIIDNGPGLTDDQKSKLFMPYFTTKSDGTGLGLSIVRKIIEDHGGTIALHDRSDKARGAQADIIL